MLKLIRLLLAIAGIVIVAAFAVANRQPVQIGFWPHPMAIDMPLYAVLLVGIFIGMIMGGFSVWLGSLKRRIAGGEAQRKVRKAEAEAARREADQERAAIDASRKRREALALAAPET